VEAKIRVVESVKNLNLKRSPETPNQTLAAPDFTAEVAVLFFSMP
jgi:hypothetical protein